MLEKPEFYGSTTVGERGQVVLPAAMREKFDIKAGDKMLVMGIEHMKGRGVILVKAEVLAAVLENMGSNISEVLEQSKKAE